MVTCEELMKEGFLEKNLKWCPTGRRRWGWSRYSWMQEVTYEMRKKGTDSVESVEREEWRRKIQLKLKAQKDWKTFAHKK